MRNIKYNQRLKDLIVESQNVLNSIREESGEYGYFEEIDETLYNSWVIKSKNAIQLTFGEKSKHYDAFNHIASNRGTYRNHVKSLKGILVGAQDDYENGYVIGQEFLIAGEIFDSLLEESKHLLNTNHKDAAAILGRVVIEDSLKRLARNENINENQKASILNDELKKASLYTQPQWRLIQSYLDIGNSAAHGKFQEYDSNDVKTMLEGIEMFFAKFF